MNNTYDAGANAAYIYLSDARSDRIVDADYGLIVDLDEERRVIGVEYWAQWISLPRRL